MIIGDVALFDGRLRRPPRDPANALLSFGYTLLGGEVSGMLASVGLGPYIGIYHETRRGVPSLAQDIIEEFRAPVVDKMVMALLNTGALGCDDFVDGPRGGVRLKSMPLRLFLNRYDAALSTEFKQRDGGTASLRRLISS